MGTTLCLYIKKKILIDWTSIIFDEPVPHIKGVAHTSPSSWYPHHLMILLLLPLSISFMFMGSCFFQSLFGFPRDPLQLRFCFPSHQMHASFKLQTSNFKLQNHCLPFRNGFFYSKWEVDRPKWNIWPFSNGDIIWPGELIVLLLFFSQTPRFDTKVKPEIHSNQIRLHLLLFIFCFHPTHLVKF